MIDLDPLESILTASAGTSACPKRVARRLPAVAYIAWRYTCRTRGPCPGGAATSRVLVACLPPHALVLGHERPFCGQNPENPHVSAGYPGHSRYPPPRHICAANPQV